MDEVMNRKLDKHSDGQTDGWMDKWTDGWMYGWYVCMDGCTDRLQIIQVYMLCAIWTYVNTHVYIYIYNVYHTCMWNQEDKQYSVDDCRLW